MPSNLYAPPVAVVSEMPSLDTPSIRPRHVTFAVWLLWVNVLLGIFVQVARLGIAKPGLSPGTTIAIGLIGICVGVALVYWVARKLSQGRDWMRIALLVLSLLGICILPFLWRYRAIAMAAYGGSTLRVVVEMTRIVIGWFVVGLLFTTQSRAWFRR